MTGFGNNLSFNILSAIKNIGKQAKEVLNKEIFNKANQIEQTTKNIQQAQANLNQNPVNQSISLAENQSTLLTNNAASQAALNTSNQPQTNLNSDIKNISNIQVKPTPSQAEFQGPKDLPAYAGIANMSLKSWIAGHDSKNLVNVEPRGKELTTTLEGIKGFQRQNQEGFDGDSEKGRNAKGLKLPNRNKNLLILSHIFSDIEQSGSQETELFVNITNFKKLGSSLKENESNSTEEELYSDIKLAPPLPNELQKLDSLDPTQIKYLHQLLALPSEFPECLRLFAKDNIEINPRDLNSFLMQRLELAQGQIFGGDKFLNKTISDFVPLLKHIDFPVLLPLILLYYPLPLPNIKEFDFLHEWRKKKKEANKDLDIIASCEIYYLSKIRGRFLLKFLLNEKQELSFDVQTSAENNGIVQDLEVAVAESMYLLEKPPLLTDLNVMLTEEIYKATDLDEELSIVSTGPLRLEIVLAVYAVLIALNKLNDEPDPSGLIEMND
ncbi:MAG: hypothetical protein HY094_03555 [Candidatus Melainabacteria bacterium]|nr:hypothetical protein [Candidatus Melainabacteria bacterium]